MFLLICRIPIISQSINQSIIYLLVSSFLTPLLFLVICLWNKLGILYCGNPCTVVDISTFSLILLDLNVLMSDLEGNAWNGKK